MSRDEWGHDASETDRNDRDVHARAAELHTGELSDAEADALRRRAERDPDLRQAIDAQRTLDRHTSELPTYRGPDRRRAQASSRRRHRSLLWAGGSLSAAAILMLFLGSLRSGGGGSSPESVGIWRVGDLDAALIGEMPRNPADSLLWLGFGICSEQVVSIPHGVYLCVLDPNGMLAEAGVEPGDTVVMLNDVPIDGPTAFSEIFASVERGARVELRIRGSLGERTIPVFAEVRPLEGYPFDVTWSEALERHTTTLGPDEISPSELFERVPDSDQGVMGMRVTRAVDLADWERVRLLRLFPSPFVEGGVEAGDVIVEYDGRRPTEYAELYEAIGRQRDPGESMRVTVRRGDRLLQLEIPIR